MHYLSEYYKNLCEQLQEKLNILEAELGRVQANTKREREDLEAAAMNPSYSSTPDPKSDLIRVTAKPKVIDKKIDGGPKIRPKPRPASENPRLKKENPKPVNEAMSEDEARGMPVPILRSGKGGNYADWRAANDARNAALRNARLGVGNRDKVNAAREKRKKAASSTSSALGLPPAPSVKPSIPGIKYDITDIMPTVDKNFRDDIPLNRDRNIVDIIGQRKPNQIREANDSINITPPPTSGKKDVMDFIKPSKSKRTPEQQKALDEWDAKYGLFAKDRPKGKVPRRPYDPDEPPPQTIG